MKAIAALLLTGAIAAFATFTARAAEPVEKPKAEAKAAEPKRLTDESLLAMLENMGYEPKVEKTSAGNIYSITVTRGTWSYIFDVSLSPSKTKLWFSGWLSVLPEGKAVPSEKLLALLEASWTHGPAHFRYHPPFRQLNLGLCLDNRDITPTQLREQIEGFMDTMKKTELLWNVKKWDEKQNVTIGKPADKKDEKPIDKKEEKKGEMK
jgi:hypothetical protein